MANITQNIVSKLKNHEERLKECERLKGYTTSDDVKHIFDQKFNEKNSGSYATQDELEETFQKYVSSKDNMMSQFSSNQSSFDDRLNKFNEQFSNLLNQLDTMRGELNKVKKQNEELKSEHDALSASHSALSVRHDELLERTNAE
tara:strand:- start:638 stop:1072 length:435 start_codon:yes stop_codon:yes gene_type:complete